MNFDVESGSMIVMESNCMNELVLRTSNKSNGKLNIFSKGSGSLFSPWQIEAGMSMKTFTNEVYTAEMLRDRIDEINMTFTSIYDKIHPVMRRYFIFWRVAILNVLVSGIIAVAFTVFGVSPRITIPFLITAGFLLVISVVGLVMHNVRITKKVTAALAVVFDK
jgi:hypothetical protein